MKATADKILVLGVDGFDPSLAKKYMDQGKMPNLKKYVERGSAREDLVMLGAMPTVTPPMWGTLSSGAYPMTHGITQFFNQHPEKLDTMVYALDSRMFKAEQLWNVFAEAGKQTLVWHWPGGSWPPTSDSSNLSVVEGTQPFCINLGVGLIDWQKMGVASSEFSELRYANQDAERNQGAGCIITDLDDAVAPENEEEDNLKSILANALEFKTIMLSEDDGEIATNDKLSFDVINSPIKAAQGWANAPADAKEFIMLTSNGYVRRPCLILKNDQGIYDRVAVYKSKKETTPMAILENDVLTRDFIDEIQVGEEIKIANRWIRILEMAPDGSFVRYFMSMAIDINQDAVFHPKELLQEVNKNIGHVPGPLAVTGRDVKNAEKLSIPFWDYYCEWQADCLTYFMEKNKYEVIFSHLHNVDAIGHMLYHFAKHQDEWGNDEKPYQTCMEKLYEQTDRYLGRFFEFLDKDWTIIITSDHGLISQEHLAPVLTELGVNVPVMRELGYTELKKDADGNDLREIDWSKTKAVATRSGHIYLNLKGRNPYGIVDPADQYDLEAEIISALYNYRDPKTGRRVVSIALRNRDAAVIGMGGPECGDIIFFMEEGYTLVHADSLSTQCGYYDTSVSPIFVAAGKGIKAGCTTERVIRQVDVAPTVAVLGGVRMPAQCEGAPVYQILTEEY